MNPTTSDAALGQLQSAQGSAQDPNAILQQQQKALGVDQAQNTVTGLRGAIDNTTRLLSQVAPSVMGRTANSLVTNAQATRQVGNEQAPISANLTKQTGDYNNATTDLNNLQSKAQTAATGIYQGQQDKLSYAQNLYNTLFAKEQAAQTQTNQANAAAEQQREFNANQASKASASSSAGLGGVLGSLTGTGAATPSSTGAQAQQRTGGGFNFQDTGGNAINAVQYSQAKGIPIRTQLQGMANEGDKGAKAALDYVGNDYGVNTGKLRNLLVSPSQYNQTVGLLKSLGFKV